MVQLIVYNGLFDGFNAGDTVPLYNVNWQATQQGHLILDVDEATALDLLTTYEPVNLYAVSPDEQGFTEKVELKRKEQYLQAVVNTYEQSGEAVPLTIAQAQLDDITNQLNNL